MRKVTRYTLSLTEDDFYLILCSLREMAKQDPDRYTQIAKRFEYYYTEGVTYHGKQSFKKEEWY